MRLIGTLASPYVRRVAISLKMIGVCFQLETLSVLRDFEKFAAINAVVKAPTLVTDTGLAILDSNLILEYIDRISLPERRLTPGSLKDFIFSQHLLGLALAACEKSVQCIYEQTLRPPEKRHQPWLERIERQLLAAYDLLDAGLASANGWQFGDRPMQADITAAVVWRFTQSHLSSKISEDRYPNLSTLSNRSETLLEFSAFPIE